MGVMDIYPGQSRGETEPVRYMGYPDHRGPIWEVMDKEQKAIDQAYSIIRAIEGPDAEVKPLKLEQLARFMSTVKGDSEEVITEKVISRYQELTGWLGNKGY